MGPFDAAGTDILHLRLVADEGIAGDAVPLRAGGEVDADRAALEAVVVDAVHMGVVDEQALAVAAAHDVAGDLRRLHEVHEQAVVAVARSEEHTSELQSLMRISYAVFCLKKKTENQYRAQDDGYSDRIQRHAN